MEVGDGQHFNQAILDIGIASAFAYIYGEGRIHFESPVWMHAAWENSAWFAWGFRTCQKSEGPAEARPLTLLGRD